MTNNIYKMTCLATLIFGSFFIGSTVKSIAQTDVTPMAESETKTETHPSFPGVVPFSTASGRFGFFETGTGKIFIYDDNLSLCTFIGKLKSLGEPIEKIQ